MSADLMHTKQTLVFATKSALMPQEPAHRASPIKDASPKMSLQKKDSSWWIYAVGQVVAGQWYGAFVCLAILVSKWYGAFVGVTIRVAILVPECCLERFKKEDG